MQLSDLKPTELWAEFFHICTIPHGSGNIEALRTSLKKRAEDHGFQATEFEDSGNLLIIKPADAGFENAPTVCVQGHLDMVCSKNSASTHDFLKDAIKPQIAEIDG